MHDEQDDEALEPLPHELRPRAPSTLMSSPIHEAEHEEEMAKHVAESRLLLAQRLAESAAGVLQNDGGRLPLSWTAGGGGGTTGGSVGGRTRPIHTSKFVRAQRRRPAWRLDAPASSASSSSS